MREPDSVAVATPPLFMAFDILHYAGRDLTSLPLHDRRARLEDTVAASELVFAVRRRAADGLEAWKLVVERGSEGLRREGRGQHVRGRSDEAVVEGDAERLDRRGGPLAAADPRKPATS